MSVPDLAQAASAGVRDWSGATDALKSAAAAATLRFRQIDLHGVASKAELMTTLGKGLGLPPHFGANWDALADAIEDSDWLGPHGLALVLRHTAPYRKAHPADWETLTDIMGEAAEYWRDLHKPFWVFVG
ncbi:MAG: barstar family protein [Betaproteobacteria bacterium]